MDKSRSMQPHKTAGASKSHAPAAWMLLPVAESVPARRQWGQRFLAAYVGVNLLLAYAVCGLYLRDVSWPSTHLAQLYLISMYIGHVGLVFFLVGWLVPAILDWFIRSCWLLCILPVILMVLLYTYLFIDIAVVNNFHFHFNGFFMSMIFSRAGGDIFQFSVVEWSLLIGFSVLVVALQIILLTYLWRRYRRAARGLAVYHWSALPRIITLAVIVGCWALSQVINAWGYANFLPNIMTNSTVFPFYYGLTAHAFLEKHHFIDAKALAQAHNEAYQPVHGNLNVSLHKIRLTGAHLQHDNILFLLIDTWRADTMTARNSPAIADFARHNLVFTKHWSGGDCTQPGIFSLFYGIPASYWPRALGSRQSPVFINVLQRLGYHFSIHGSADLTVPPFNATVFAHIKPLELSTPGKESWQKDAVINRDMITLIKHQAYLERHQRHVKPFFGYAFYDAVHGYSYPPNFHLKFRPVWGHIDRLMLNNNTKRTQFFNIYKNAVLYDDGLIAKVLKTLRDEHMLDHTIVVISSDHGNEFNDNHHDYWGHGSNFSPVQMHVPMIVHWPGKAARRYSYYTSHFDLTSTLLRHALGVSNPFADYSVGKDLFVPHSWRFLVVGSYQRLGVVEHNRLTTFYHGGYYKQTTPHLMPIKQAISPAVMHQVFKQMQRYLG